MGSEMCIRDSCEMADDFAGLEDFGQKVDLTVRIREILRNYPEGTSIVKELVQNADDAGAHEFKLCLDERAHASAALVSDAMAGFQGLGLLAYNSAQFREADWASIQRIGDSLKKAGSAGAKTGRFGIGFNSVYHLTELPQFASGTRVIWFDPQARFLPGVNPANPGKMIDFVQSAGLLAKCPDQFAPLRAFGCDLAREYRGTLFRFPLRTAAQAAESKLSRQSYDAASARAMIDEV